MSELALQCGENLSLETMIKMTVVNADDGTPYVDCDNKNESLDSLLKRMIVELPDGSLALQVSLI
jgi:hypothetical protein